MIQIKPNSRVLITEHKDNTNPLTVDKIGTVKLIKGTDGIDLYYIQMDENVDGFPYKSLNIPVGYGYLAVYEELALVE